MIVADSNLIAYLLIPGDKNEVADEVLLKDADWAVPSDDILELSFHHNITAYDGEFVVLAKQLRVHLVTFDKAVLKAFPNIAISAEDFLNT